jgi:hypothetical protein
MGAGRDASLPSTESCIAVSGGDVRIAQLRHHFIIVAEAPDFPVSDLKPHQ